MKINKNELSGKLSQLKSIVPAKPVNEALKGVLYADGYLIASDINVTVKARLEGIEDVVEPFIIPAKAFDFINSLPSGELEISIDDGNIIFETGKIRNQFRTLAAVLFSYNKNIDTEAERAKIPAQKLKKAIEHVIYAVSQSTGNSLMQGLYLECRDGKLNFVGLDGHRIAWDCINYEGDFKLIVPRNAMEIVKKLDFVGDISIYYDQNGVLFKSDEFEVYTRVIQGEYYKYTSMFNKGTLFTIVERRVLMEAINRAKLCGSAEDKQPVIMNMEGEAIRITYRGVAAEYHEDIPVMEPFENDLKIGFNPLLVLDCLKAFECENVTLEFTSDKLPMLIKADDSDMIALILPVAIK